MRFNVSSVDGRGAGTKLMILATGSAQSNKEELCEESVGEHPRTVHAIELLFTSLEPLPALCCCERLQELT